MTDQIAIKTQNRHKAEFSTAIYKESGNSRHFQKTFEIIIVLKGTCTCSLNEQTYSLSKGDAIFICPLQAHDFTVGKDSTVRNIIFHEHLILTIQQSLDGRIPQNPVFQISDETLLFSSNLLDSFYGSESGPIARIQPYARRMQVKGLLYLLGGEFLNSAILIPEPKTNTVVMNIVQYIADNYRKNISLQDISKDMGYNYQYLSRIFNRYVDVNFKKLLNQYRIEQAYTLLQDTDLSISRICFECGFQSIRSFNQTCLEIFKKTPTQLRQSRLL